MGDVLKWNTWACCSTRYKKTTSSLCARIAVWRGNSDFVLNIWYASCAGMVAKSSLVKSFYTIDTHPIGLHKV